MVALRFETLRARERLREAENALELVEQLADRDCGVAMSLALINRIRLAERRVRAARAALRRVDSDSSQLTRRRSL